MTSPHSVHPSPDAAAGRQALLAECLRRARDDYASDAREGKGGRETLARYATRMDALVRDIAEPARAELSTPVVVCAVGGYGRRALCLNSDVDLLIVTAGPIGADEERFVKSLLQPMWDLRLTVGQHVRELAEMDRVEVDNPELLLSLFDIRFVAGNTALFESLQDRLDAQRLERIAEGQSLLAALTEARYARFNGTLYQLEPDVKDAPGGLRDIHALRLLDAWGHAAPEFSTGSDRLVRDAEDFLFRLRSVLHVATGRNANVLTHALQETAAEALGCEGTTAQQRVETLMSEYFRGARRVARSVAAARTAGEATAGRTAAAPKNAGKYLTVGADGVRFTDPHAVVARPSLWIEAFRVALASGTSVSVQARALIEANTGRYTADDFVATEGDRQELRRLFTPRAGLYARLSEMHDCCLLGCVFPEFARIQSRVIRDFYHRYTVDEHTLIAIRNIETLTGDVPPARERFAAMLSEVHAPDLVVLALLYHDVGKWRDDDHAAESVVMAAPMLERLQLTPEARETVTFLIEHHLVMSRMAFLRDSEDPAVVSRLAELVRTEDRLKMLCLLTWADIGAVSPDTLTPWKEELLWRLYVDAYNRLTYGYADDKIETDNAGLEVVVAGRPPDVSEAELRAFLGGLPRRYLALFGLSTIYRHVRLARDIGRDEVHTSIERHDDIYELSVATLDKPFLFSNIAGVLSYFGMNIHRAQAMTTPAGFVLDVFEFSDVEQFLGQNPGGGADIARVLQAVVAGGTDVTDLLRGKEGSLVYRRSLHVAPVVHVDNEHSASYTVVEIVADDAIGLLYRISRIVARLGCDLDLALIDTEGAKAIDVLHVTRGGRKLSPGEEAALREELDRLLEGPAAS
jgi:[protein-PII] uridylyltransferase